MNPDLHGEKPVTELWHCWHT